MLEKEKKEGPPKPMGPCKKKPCCNGDHFLLKGLKISMPYNRIAGVEYCDLASNTNVGPKRLDICPG